MRTLLVKLCNDDNGFIVSAELVLIATIAILGLGVGLSELSYNINQELEDVGSAFADLNQSYNYRLTSGTKGYVADSFYVDHHEPGSDECNINCDHTVTGM